VAHKNRLFNSQLIQRRAKQLRLDLDSYLATVIWAIAVTMARAIERHRLITPSQRRVESRPVLTGSGIAVNQHDRPTAAFDYKVKIRAVNVDEFGLCLRIVVRDTRRDIRLL